MRDRVLAIAVVIHLPNFFVAGSIAHEDDLALGDPGQSAAKTENDLVGKTMRDEPRVLLIRVFAVLLTQHLRRDGILHIVEPAGDS